MNINRIHKQLARLKDNETMDKSVMDLIDEGKGLDKYIIELLYSDNKTFISKFKCNYMKSTVTNTDYKDITEKELTNEQLTFYNQLNDDIKKSTYIRSLLVRFMFENYVQLSENISEYDETQVNYVLYLYFNSIIYNCIVFIYALKVDEEGISSFEFKEEDIEEIIEHVLLFLLFTSYFKQFNKDYVTNYLEICDKKRIGDSPTYYIKSNKTKDSIFTVIGYNHDMDQKLFTIKMDEKKNNERFFYYRYESGTSAFSLPNFLHYKSSKKINKEVKRENKNIILLINLNNDNCIIKTPLTINFFDELHCEFKFETNVKNNNRNNQVSDRLNNSDESQVDPVEKELKENNKKTNFKFSFTYKYRDFCVENNMMNACVTYNDNLINFIKDYIIRTNQGNDIPEAIVTILDLYNLASIMYDIRTSNQVDYNIRTLNHSILFPMKTNIKIEFFTIEVEEEVEQEVEKITGRIFKKKNNELHQYEQIYNGPFVLNNNIDDIIYGDSNRLIMYPQFMTRKEKKKRDRELVSSINLDAKERKILFHSKNDNKINEFIRNKIKEEIGRNNIEQYDIDTIKKGLIQKQRSNFSRNEKLIKNKIINSIKLSEQEIDTMFNNSKTDDDRRNIIIRKIFENRNENTLIENINENKISKELFDKIIDEIINNQWSIFMIKERKKKNDMERKEKEKEEFYNILFNNITYSNKLKNLTKDMWNNPNVDISYYIEKLKKLGCTYEDFKIQYDFFKTEKDIGTDYNNQITIYYNLYNSQHFPDTIEKDEFNTVKSINKLQDKIDKTQSLIELNKRYQEHKKYRINSLKQNIVRLLDLQNPGYLHIYPIFENLFNSLKTYRNILKTNDITIQQQESLENLKNYKENKSDNITNLIDNYMIDRKLYLLDNYDKLQDNEKIKNSYKKIGEIIDKIKTYTEYINKTVVTNKELEAYKNMMQHELPNNVDIRQKFNQIIGKVVETRKEYVHDRNNKVSIGKDTNELKNIYEIQQEPKEVVVEKGPTTSSVRYSHESIDKSPEYKNFIIKEEILPKYVINKSQFPEIYLVKILLLLDDSSNKIDDCITYINNHLNSSKNVREIYIFDYANISYNNDKDKPRSKKVFNQRTHTLKHVKDKRNVLHIHIKTNDKNNKFEFSVENEEENQVSKYLITNDIKGKITKINIYIPQYTLEENKLTLYNDMIKEFNDDINIYKNLISNLSSYSEIQNIDVKTNNKNPLDDFMCMLVYFKLNKLFNSESSTSTSSTSNTYICVVSNDNFSDWYCGTYVNKVAF